MTWPPEVLPLATLIALPFVGVLLSGATGSSRSPEFAVRGLAATFWLSAGLAVWLSFQTAAAPLDWNAGTWLKVPGRFAWQADWSWRAEPLRLWWVASVLGAGGLALISQRRDSGDSWTRPRLLASAVAHAACAAQWLAAEPWLVLFCHAVTGVAAFAALGTGSGRPAAGPAARKWLITSLIGDTFLLGAVVLLLPVMNGEATWNTATMLAHVAERVPALPGVIAAALVLGSLARAALWPFNDWLHEVTDGPAPQATLVIATAVWPSGLCWLVTTGPWLTQTPAAQLLAAGLGLLTAVTSPFFALGQSSPRRMAGWLLAGHSGLLVAAVALEPQLAGASGLAGLSVMSAVVLLWRLADAGLSDAAPELRLAQPPPPGQRRLAWAIGVVALCPAATFVAGPLLLHVASRDVTAIALDQPAASSPVLPGTAVAAAVLLACALHGAAGCQLARRMAITTGGDSDSLLSVPLGLLAVLPLAWWPLSASRAGGLTALAVASGLLGGAVLLGAGAAYLLMPFASRNSPGWDSLSRLSRQRLHVDGAVFLLINVPIRALAQLGRFCEWFVLDNLLYGQFARLPDRAGRELRRLQTGQASFYALVAVLVTGTLLVTLLHIRP